MAVLTPGIDRSQEFSLKVRFVLNVQIAGGFVEVVETHDTKNAFSLFQFSFGRFPFGNLEQVDATVVRIMIDIICLVIDVENESGFAGLHVFGQFLVNHGYFPVDQDIGKKVFGRVVGPDDLIRFVIYDHAERHIVQGNVFAAYQFLFQKVLPLEFVLEIAHSKCISATAEKSHQSHKNRQAYGKNIN